MGSAAGVDDVHGRGRHGAGDHHRMPDAATMNWINIGCWAVAAVVVAYVAYVLHLGLVIR